MEWLNFQWEDDEPYDDSYVTGPEYSNEDDRPQNYTWESEFEQVKTLGGGTFWEAGLREGYWK